MNISRLTWRWWGKKKTATFPDDRLDNALFVGREVRLGGGRSTNPNLLEEGETP